MSLSGRFVEWLQRRQQRRNCQHTATHEEKWPEGSVYCGQGDYVYVTVCDDCGRAVKGAEYAYQLPPVRL